jgi:hypothetical protein
VLSVDKALQAEERRLVDGQHLGDLVQRLVLQLADAALVGDDPILHKSYGVLKLEQELHEAIARAKSRAGRLENLRAVSISCSSISWSARITAAAAEQAACRKAVSPA